MKLIITRVSTDDDVGTFGTLQWADDKAPFAVCLEDPWKNNQTNVSCIPAGTYTCERFDSPTHGPTFQVMNVPDRTYILFHKGNTHVNTQGCVLLGESYEHIGGVPGIANSRQAFQQFWNKCSEEQSFELEVRWAS